MILAQIKMHLLLVADAQLQQAARPTPASGSAGWQPAAAAASAPSFQTPWRCLLQIRERRQVLAALQAKGQAHLTREEAKARKRSLKRLGELPGFSRKTPGCDVIADWILAAASGGSQHGLLLHQVLP